ncbi:MAG TPA: ATP-binding protein [Gemmatimonadales bacterium]|nr:ATP-binding protein [Gemmatimonadales bacterium]
MNAPLQYNPDINRAGALLSWVAGLVALVGITGWVVGSPMLVRIGPAYPPIAFNSALGLLAASVGLNGVSTGRNALVLPGAALAMLLGGATLLEYLAGTGSGLDRLFFAHSPLHDPQAPFPGRMPGTSALSLVLAGPALLTLGYRRAEPVGRIIAGTLGSIVAALAIAVLLSYATGLLSSIRGGMIAGLSIPSCIGYSALGLGLMRLSWRRDGSASMIPEWVPYGVGLAMLIATLVVWQALEATRPSMESLENDLPIVVAAFGAAVSVLVTMTLRLLQSSDAAARVLERARLTHALESATDGLWELDLRTGETSRSAGVWRRLGYEPSRGGALGSNTRWESLVHPEDRPEYEARMKRHLAGTSDAFEAEYRVRAQNADWHWILDRGRVVERDERNRPSRMVGVSADVTERRRSDQALLASEHRFRSMFDSGFQLQHLLDVDCNMLEANRTSLDFAGVTIDQVRGKPFWDTPWWSGQEAGQGRLRKACKDALAGTTVRYQDELRGADGRLTLMDFSLTPIIDSERRVIQLLAESRDISEQQRVENTLRELDTLSTMGRLAARVAHEINNPLAGIQNSFLLIKGAIPPSHPYFAYVGAIEREIARMAAITRQLYETYRPDGDGREEASIPILISDAVTMLQQVNRTTQVRIEVDTSDAPPVLRLPGALLRQAVYNLVQNAVEASPPGGTVRVRAWRTDNTFLLSVTDQGPGVPADIRARIFEPFVTTKSGIRTGGMGLGLSLVKRSVQALGGRIDLRDPESGGAEFQIAIPLR